MPIRSIEMADANPADLSDCREQLRVGSRSFHAAAYLLPACFREPASALYAFCRIADDAIDGVPDPQRVLPALHRRLDALYAGRPLNCSADRALATVVAQQGIPRELLDALLEGFAWDAQGRRYGDFGEVLDYAARVAGTVGAMMALLMGVRRDDVLARACDLGVAMQLTNIARDVGEDARAGRLYLPEDWLLAAGVDSEAFLARPEFSPALGHVIERMLGEADTLYRRADSGIAQLPLRCRPAMYAARLLYAEIGREIRRRRCDSVSRRAVVSPARKLVTLARVPLLGLLPRAALGEPALDATLGLVGIGARAPGVRRPLMDDRGGVPARSGGKLASILDLFEELERRERGGSPQVLARESSALATQARMP